MVYFFISRRKIYVSRREIYIPKREICISRREIENVFVGIFILINTLNFGYMGNT